MVKINEACSLIDHEQITALSNVGVEVLSMENLWGTYLASDILPEDGEVTVRVYVQKKDGEYKCVEEDTSCASDLYDAMDEEGMSEGSEVIVWFVDWENGETIAKFEPCAVWANIERDEITFTVKTPVFEIEDAEREAVLRDCQEIQSEDTEEEHVEIEYVPEDVEDVYTVMDEEGLSRDQITDINIYKASEGGLFVAEKIGSYWNKYNIVETRASFQGNTVEFQPYVAYLGSEENLRKFFKDLEGDMFVNVNLSENTATVEDYGLEECMVENVECAFKTFYAKKISENPGNPTPTLLLIPKGTHLLIL